MLWISHGGVWNHGDACHAWARSAETVHAAMQGNGGGAVMASAWHIGDALCGSHLGTWLRYLPDHRTHPLALHAIVDHKWHGCSESSIHMQQRTSTSHIIASIHGHAGVAQGFMLESRVTDTPGTSGSRDLTDVLRKDRKNSPRIGF